MALPGASPYNPPAIGAKGEERMIDRRKADGRSFGAWVEDTRAAVMFLTILPVRAAAPAWPRVLRAFPLAGGLIGALAGGALALGLFVGLSPWVAAAFGLLAALLASGAMHEDGLADFADSLGGATPARRLEIMRDPASGAFGVLALILAVVLQLSALAALIGARGGLAALFALVAAHALSRLFAVLMLHRLPPARAEGRGHEASRPDGRTLLQAAAAAAIACAPLLAGGCGLWQGVLAAALGWALAEGFIGISRRLLGGQTGDALGALEVLTRTSMLLALSAA